MSCLLLLCFIHYPERSLAQFLCVAISYLNRAKKYCFVAIQAEEWSAEKRWYEDVIKSGCNCLLHRHAVVSAVSGSAKVKHAIFIWHWALMGCA